MRKKWGQELKEKFVMALVGTTRRQCVGVFGDQSGARCAVGVILTDVLGRQLEYEGSSYCGAPIWDVELPLALQDQIVAANDSGKTFDDIAKIVKDFPVIDS